MRNEKLADLTMSCRKKIKYSAYMRLAISVDKLDEKKKCFRGSYVI